MQPRGLDPSPNPPLPRARARGNGTNSELHLTEPRGTGEDISPTVALSGGPEGRYLGGDSASIMAQAMEAAGLGSEVCPSVPAPRNPKQKPVVRAGRGKGKTPL